MNPDQPHAAYGMPAWAHIRVGRPNSCWSPMPISIA
jgi:hypothetical protein